MFCPLSPAPAHRPGHARSHAHAGGRTPRPWSSWRHVPTRERHCGTRAVHRADIRAHTAISAWRFSVNFPPRRVSVRLICKKCSESQSERDTVL